MDGRPAAPDDPAGRAPACRQRRWDQQPRLRHPGPSLAGTTPQPGTRPDRPGRRPAGQLSAAVAVPAAQQRDEVWAAITAHFQVPASAGAQDCENRAHAICELINAQFPGLARRHLTKIWLIAPNPTLHPPQNWKHHVAPVLACQDGDYAFDLFLSPGAPLTMAAWLTAAQGTRAAGDAGLWHGQRVWDLFGRPDPQIDPGTLDTGAFVDRRPAASNIQ